MYNFDLMIPNQPNYINHYIFSQLKIDLDQLIELMSYVMEKSNLYFVSNQQNRPTYITLNEYNEIFLEAEMFLFFNIYTPLPKMFFIKNTHPLPHAYDPLFMKNYLKYFVASYAYSYVVFGEDLMKGICFT